MTHATRAGLHFSAVLLLLGMVAAGCDPTGPVKKAYIHGYTQTDITTGKKTPVIEYRLVIDDQQAGPQDIEVSRETWGRCTVGKFYPDCDR